MQLRKQFSKLLLGDETRTWGEITRFVADKLDPKNEVKVSDELKTHLNSWLQNAPNLASSAVGMLANTYALKLDPSLAKGIADGTLSMMSSLQGGVRGQVVDKSGIVRGAASFVSLGGVQGIATAAMAWQLVSMVAMPYYLLNINANLERLSSRLEQIKSFLEQKEYALLAGNLAYLRNIQADLKHQPDVVALQTFHHQFETIERETLQVLSFLDRRLNQTAEQFAKVNLEKAFFVFRDDNKVKVLRDLVTDFESQSESYLLALSVRTLAAQLKASLTGGYNLGMSRLESTVELLPGWQVRQDNFYDLVQKRAVELDGMATDGKNPQEEFISLAAKGKSQAQEHFGTITKSMHQAIEEIKAWHDLPTSIVVELDNAGQLRRVFRMPPALTTV